LTVQVMGYYTTHKVIALMARPDISFSVMLMADRERNELQAGAVPLRALAF